MPRPDELHRATGLPRAQGGDNLHGDVFLAPESTTHRRMDHAGFLKREIKHGGDILLVVDRALAAHIHCYPALLRHSQPGLGLQISVLDERGVILPLDYHVRLGESFFNVALTDGDVAQQIAFLVFLVDDRRALGQRLLGILDHRQRLVFDLDEGQRGLGLGLGLCVHGGDGVAQVADAILGKDRLVLADDPKAVPAGDIFGSEHRHHAGRAFGSRRIHAQQAGMGMCSAEHFSVEHALHFEVSGVFETAGDFVHPVHAGHAPPDDLILGRPQVADRHFAHARTEHAPRLPDGGDDGPVARAAAQVTLESLLDLIQRWARVLVQQRLAGHHHARRTEPALDGPLADHRVLERMQAVALGQALDGLHAAPVHPLHLQQAGSLGFTVHDDRAGPTRSLRAAVFSARQAQLLPQKGEERHLGVNLGLDGLTVYIKTDFHFLRH